MIGKGIQARATGMSSQRAVYSGVFRSRFIEKRRLSPATPPLAIDTVLRPKRSLSVSSVSISCVRSAPGSSSSSSRCSTSAACRSGRQLLADQRRPRVAKFRTSERNSGMSEFRQVVQVSEAPRRGAKLPLIRILYECTATAAVLSWRRTGSSDTAVEPWVWHKLNDARQAVNGHCRPVAGIRKTCGLPQSSQRR